MNKKKILILGATGLVGNALWEEFNEDANYKVHGTFYSYREKYRDNILFCDTRNILNLTEIVHLVEPDIIINATAFANVDKCEIEKEECWRVNVGGLQNLIFAAPNTYIVHFSTDYVFDGTEDSYGEQHTPNPINYYGVSKLCGEMLLLGYQKSLIIRTTGVYGWELQKKNFVYKVLNMIGKGIELKVPGDQIGCPTYAPNLAEITKKLVEKEITGIAHVNGGTRLTRYAFARDICIVFELPQSLLNVVETKDLAQTAKRPLKGGLKADYVKGLLPGISLLKSVEGLDEMKKELIRRGEYAVT